MVLGQYSINTQAQLNSLQTELSIISADDMLFAKAKRMILHALEQCFLIFVAFILLLAHFLAPEGTFSLSFSLIPLLLIELRRFFTLAFKIRHIDRVQMKRVEAQFRIATMEMTMAMAQGRVNQDGQGGQLNQASGVQIVNENLNDETIDNLINNSHAQIQRQSQNNQQPRINNQDRGRNQRLIQLQKNHLRIKRVMKIRDFAESMAYQMFFIFILISNHSSLPYTVSCIWPVLGFLQRFLWFRQIKKEYDSYTKIALLVWKALINMIFLNFSMKLDSFIDWRWEAVLWPVYIICSLALVCSVSSTLICAGSICGTIIKQQQNLFQQSNGSMSAKYCLGIFSLYVINGFTGACLLSILKFIKMMSSKDDPEAASNSYADNGLQLALFPALYCFGLMVITLINFKNMQRWIINNLFKQEISSQASRQRSSNQNPQVAQSYLEEREQEMIRQHRARMRAINNQSQSQQQQVSENSLQKEIRMRDEDSPETTPRFIMIISGSYYKTLKDYSNGLYSQLQKISVGRSKQGKVQKVQKIKPQETQTKVQEQAVEKTNNKILAQFYIKESVQQKMKSVQIQSSNNNHAMQKIKDIKKSIMLEDKDDEQIQQSQKQTPQHIDLDDQNYFSDVNEIKSENQQLSNFKQTRANDYEDPTIDPYHLDTIENKRFTTIEEKQNFLDTLKKSMTNQETQKRIRHELANVSLSTVQKVFIKDQSIVCDDTYEEFKRDPQRFKEQFKRRLSYQDLQTQADDHQSGNRGWGPIKKQLVEVRKELRRRLNGYQGRKLSKENKAEELKRECLICLTGVADAVIMNCGHGGLCFDCGQKLSLNKANLRCHLCRKKIKRIMKIDVNRISGQFVPILYYLDLRGPIPEIKRVTRKSQNKKQKLTESKSSQLLPAMDIDSVHLTVNDEVLSDEEVNLDNHMLNTRMISILHVHNQQRIFQPNAAMPSSRHSSIQDDTEGHGDIRDFFLRRRLQPRRRNSMNDHDNQFRDDDIFLEFEQLEIPIGDLQDDDVQMRTIESEDNYLDTIRRNDSEILTVLNRNLQPINRASIGDQNSILLQHITL